MRALFLLAALVVASISSPARADSFLYTVNGTVDPDSSYDDLGLFGYDLWGKSFTARFLVNDTNPNSLYSYGATGSAAVGGGMVAAGTTPPLSVTLTIGDHSYTIRTGNFTQYPPVDPDTGDAFGVSIDEADFGLIAKDATAGALLLGAGYSRLESCCGSVGVYGDGTVDDMGFVLESLDLNAPDFRQTGTFALDGGYGYYARTDEYISRSGDSINFSYITLTATQLSIAAVPDAPIWAMLILSFGAVGCALRRRFGTPGSDAAQSNIHLHGETS